MLCMLCQGNHLLVHKFISSIKANIEMIKNAINFKRNVVKMNNFQALSFFHFQLLQLCDSDVDYGIDHCSFDCDCSWCWHLLYCKVTYDRKKCKQQSGRHLICVSFIIYFVKCNFLYTQFSFQVKLHL